MKSKFIILIALVVLIGGGGTAYMLSRNDGAETGNSQTADNDATTADPKEDGDQPTFQPLATENESFVATMEVTSPNEADTFSGTVERSKAGEIKFTGVQSGQAVELYLTAAGENIVCQDSQCYKLSNGTSALSDIDFTANDEELAGYKDSASYKGSESCIGGTCDVWEYTDKDNSQVTVYIQKGTNKVVELRGTDTDGSKIKMTYDYKDVTITIPENVESLPGGI